MERSDTRNMPSVLEKVLRDIETTKLTRDRGSDQSAVRLACAAPGESAEELATLRAIAESVGMRDARTLKKSQLCKRLLRGRDAKVWSDTVRAGWLGATAGGYGGFKLLGGDVTKLTLEDAKKLAAAVAAGGVAGLAGGQVVSRLSHRPSRSLFQKTNSGLRTAQSDYAAADPTLANLRRQLPASSPFPF